MLSKCGQTIPKSIKMQYANELVKLFPTLKEKYSEYGYVRTTFNNDNLLNLKNNVSFNKN